MLFDIVGDDLAHLRKKDGNVYTANVEKGMFGVIKDVNLKDDPYIYDILVKPGEIIYSNVLDVDGNPYWQGMGDVDITFADGTIGKSRFHVSCSDDAMNGPEDCGTPQGNGKDNKDEIDGVPHRQYYRQTVAHFSCGSDDVPAVVDRKWRTVRQATSLRREKCIAVLGAKGRESYFRRFQRKSSSPGRMERRDT